MVARILLANGADLNRLNSHGESAISLAENLPEDQRKYFHEIFSEMIKQNPLFRTIFPFLRNKSNWTMNDDQHRSETDADSNVENLLEGTENRSVTQSM